MTDRPLTAREREALAHDLTGYRRLYAQARREQRYYTARGLEFWRTYQDTGADGWRRQALDCELDASNQEQLADYLRSVIRRGEAEVEMPEYVPEPLERRDRRAIWLAAWAMLIFTLGLLAGLVCSWQGWL